MVTIDPFGGVNALKIEVFGCDGSYHYIAGPGISMDAGVTLNPQMQGAIDAPVKTLWLPGAFGQEAQGMRWERRDMVFTVQTFAEDHETWLTVDSDWRYAFDYVKQTTIRYTTSAGSREVKVRLLEEPKSYEGQTDNGKSPFLVCDSAIVMTVAAELPFYVGDPLVYEWEMPAGLDTMDFTIDLNYDGDVPVWPRWTLTGLATWTLPDFSWFSEEYSRPYQDAGRIVTLPALRKYEGVVADSDPRVQTLISESMTNVQGRWKGNDLLYPIAPGATASLPVSVKGAQEGAALRLEVPRWFTRPWSRRLP